MTSDACAGSGVYKATAETRVAAHIEGALDGAWGSVAIRMSPGGGGGSSGRIKYSSFVETGPSKSSTSSSSSTILNILVPFKNYCPSEPLIISRSSMQQQQSTSSPRHPHLQQLHSPSQIKEKLLQALDRDYHVRLSLWVSPPPPFCSRTHSNITHNSPPSHLTAKGLN